MDSMLCIESYRCVNSLDKRYKKSEKAIALGEIVLAVRRGAPAKYPLSIEPSIL